MHTTASFLFLKNYEIFLITEREKHMMLIKLLKYTGLIIRLLSERSDIFLYAWL